jgi:hypothetical protein
MMPHKVFDDNDNNNDQCGGGGGGKYIFANSSWDACDLFLHELFLKK